MAGRSGKHGSHGIRKTGRVWVRKRKEILEGEPCCRKCRKEGRVRLAVEVDHILRLADGGTDDDDNLQPLCKECHDEKTRKENGWKDKPKFDAQGMPLGKRHHWNQDK